LAIEAWIREAWIMGRFIDRGYPALTESMPAARDFTLDRSVTPA
jgi:hypothetical protein